MIEIKNLSKSYKNNLAVNDVSLTIKDGELFGLLGVNGAGKTTIIKILSGLINNSSGEVFIDGLSIDKDMNKIKEFIDVSPQETAIAPNLSVKENLEFFARVRDNNSSNIINEVINTFKLDEVINQRAKTLSGGWQRRLSIAIALISSPKILFLDEPTLGLDVLARRELWKIILSLKGKITIVLTSHYLEEIEALCDRVAILAKGKMLTVGTCEEIKEKTQCTNFEDAFIKVVEEA
jgi:ABC-2 type transport system ATP-binding protein